MGKETASNKRTDNEIRTANEVIEKILSKVKDGTASKGDIAAAREINSEFGLGYSGDIEIGASIVATNEAAKATERPPVNPATEPNAALNSYDKFLKSPEMKQVLSVHEKMARGEQATKEEFAQATKNVFDKHNEHLKEHQKIAARKATLEAKWKAGTQTPEEKEEHSEILKRDKIAKKIKVHHEVVTQEAKKTGRSVAEILADNNSSLEVQGKIGEKHKIIDHNAALETLRITAPYVPPKKEADIGVVNTGAKRGPPPIHHTTEYRTAGDSKHPDPTPGKGGGNSRQTGKLTETTR